MASKCKKSKIWPYRPWKLTFRAIQPNLSFDMWFMSPQRSSMPKKKKSYWSVSEIDPSPPQSWRTDRQTDGRTDRRTTDKSVLEKLRCLSAGGAKKLNPSQYLPGSYLVKAEHNANSQTLSTSFTNNVQNYTFVHEPIIRHNTLTYHWFALRGIKDQQHKWSNVIHSLVQVKKF